MKYETLLFLLTVFNNSALSSGLSVVEIVYIASIQLIMHTVRSGPGTPGWISVHSVASFVLLLIQLDRFRCPNRKQRISYSLKVLEDRCLKADLNMSSSVFWGRSPSQTSLCTYQQSCPSAAETCRRMSEFIKKTKRWHWDVFHCFLCISWNGSQLRLLTTTCPLLFTVIVTEIDAMSENQWGWERGVSEEGDERFSLQHPSTKPKGKKSHIVHVAGIKGSR